MKSAIHPKPRLGRPPLTDQNGERYMIHVPPKLAEQLRTIGAGSISLGVIRLAGARPDMPVPSGPRPRTPAQQRRLERARARAQKALDIVNRALNEKLQGIQP